MRRDAENPRPLEGQWWAYSLDRVVFDHINRTERVLRDDDEYPADSYRIVFRDKQGEELMRY